MEIIYSKYNTKIVDSYKLNDLEVEIVVDDIIKDRIEKKLPVTRTRDSYIAEVKAHNRLYKLGVQRERTKDADLEENINVFRNLAYKFLGL